MSSPYRAWKSLSSKRWYGTSAILCMIRALICWADSACRRLVAVSLTIRSTVSSANRPNRTPSSTTPRATTPSVGLPARTRPRPCHTTSSTSGYTTDSSPLAAVPMTKADRSTRYSSLSVLTRSRRSRPIGHLVAAQRDRRRRPHHRGVFRRQEVRHAGDQRQTELLFQPEPLPVRIEIQEHVLATGRHDDVDRSEVDLEAAHHAVECRLHGLGEVVDLVLDLSLVRDGSGAPVLPRALL